MPEIHYYTVTETREVKVAAHSTDDAAGIATATFLDRQDAQDGVWGYPTSPVRSVGLCITERR